jgi:PadR family transcriptional regulator PadR
MKKLLEQLLGKNAGRSGDTGVPSLSVKEALILQMLAMGKEMYGLQLVDSSSGELKRGTVYVTLSRMEGKGFIVSRKEEQPAEAIGLPRRLYKITGVGAQTLHAWERAAAALVGIGATT